MIYPPHGYQEEIDRYSNSCHSVHLYDNAYDVRKKENINSSQIYLSDGEHC